MRQQLRSVKKMKRALMDARNIFTVRQFFCSLLSDENMGSNI
jgi:hypothetical protein